METQIQIEHVIEAYRDKLNQVENELIFAAAKIKSLEALLTQTESEEPAPESEEPAPESEEQTE